MICDYPNRQKDVTCINVMQNIEKSTRMKDKTAAKAGLLVALMVIITACGETYIEEHQNAYTAQDVVPVVLGVNGPTTAYQTETRDYTVSYNRAGSSWDWNVTGANLQDVSGDTRTATIHFPSKPANDTVYISVTETTSGGVVSPEKLVKVNVASFCQFNINNFIGAYLCDEAGYGPYDVNFTKHPTLANTIVNDNFWAYPASGAVIYYTFSGDFLEEVTVPKQDFEFGDGYLGWVEGSGTYDGCDHTMTMVYTMDYDGDEYTVYHSFTPATKGTTYNTNRRKSKEYFNR